MKSVLGRIAIITFFCLISHFASAENLRMKGRMFLQPGKYDIHIATQAPDSNIKMGNTIGIVLFDDGTIAEKHYIFSQNNRDLAGEGSLVGFAVYRFPGGDSMMFEFDGAWDKLGNAGNYNNFLYGTGRFEGATVTGTWVTGSSPWIDTFIVDITLNINLAE